MSSVSDAKNPAQLEYLPVMSEAAGVITRCRAARVLVVGGHLFAGAEETVHLRWQRSVNAKLPTGTYVFNTADGTWVMAVLDGALPSQPHRSSWTDPDDDPLILAYQWFDSWWIGADPIPSPLFDIGAQALLSPDDQEAIIRSRQFELDQWFYTVRSKGRTIDVRESALKVPEADDDPAEWIARAPDPVTKLAANITRAKLTEQLTDTVYSFRASRTVFRPYQFRPVLKLLESGQLRLLVADEVGLGKTIEAGLLWTELDARRQANRVLIVSPSGLVSKWKAEMSQRFGYELEELTSSELGTLLERFEADKFPGRFHGIVSVERLRIWAGLERLAEIGPRFDLVIVDEAHVFRNEGTKSHALGSLLSDWADALVFLSATPLNLGNDDLFNLLQLLSPGEFDDRATLERRLEPNAVLNEVNASLLDSRVDPARRRELLAALDTMTFGVGITSRPEFQELQGILEQPLSATSIVRARQVLRRLHVLESVVTRTRKTEVQEKRTVREPHAIDVRWTDVEADLYQKIDAWQRRRARAKGIPAGFAMQMPMRLASTCLPAARNQVLARAAGQILSGVILEDEELFEDEEVEGFSAEGDDSSSHDLPPADVVAAAQKLGNVDTKFSMFLENLRPIVESGRRVLVFSFSRPTLAYLHERLSSHMKVRVMHGGVDKEERNELMTRFRQGHFDVLLASRVASEGLDFEFCSAVVNYDLPWNPMEVEQRIGRADRFGQEEEKILIFNFHTPGTIETDIIERVHQRIGVFTSSIGELEPILRSRFSELRKTMFDYDLTEEQRALRLNATLAAIEEQRVALEEVERSSGLLASADQAEIEGLEHDLTSTGRYLGQPELVLLLQSWVSRSLDATIRVSDDRRTLHIAGSAHLEADLRLVQADGERSAYELDHLAAKLRSGVEVHISLDQEHARKTGLPLLNSNHPFVRAAIASGTIGLSRFAIVKLQENDIRPGRYLCVISIARWRGVRSSNELWTCAIDLDNLDEYTQVGDRLLATLADNKWLQGSSSGRVPPEALRAAVSGIRSRSVVQATERSEANSRLIEVRRLSLEETFRRKRSVIEKRIATARQNRSDVAVRLGESQLFMQDRLLAEARAELDRTMKTSMEVEHLAVCLVEVTQ